MTGVCRRPWVRMAVILAAPMLATVGCGGTTGEPARAASIEVVTGLYPLAQAAAQVGGPAVSVTDVVPPGRDPRTYTLSAAQKVEVRRASVVILAGVDFQPSLD